MSAVKSLVERCGKAVGWQRLLYMLKLLSVPEGGGKEDLPSSEEGFLAEDGTASRDSSSSSRLVCVDG